LATSTEPETQGAVMADLDGAADQGHHQYLVASHRPDRQCRTLMERNL
jgi:hypothetical protein